MIAWRLSMHLRFCRKRFQIIIFWLEHLIIWSASSTAATRMDLCLNCHSIGSRINWFLSRAYVRLKNVFHPIVNDFLRVMEEKTFSAVGWTWRCEVRPHGIYENSIIGQGPVIATIWRRSSIESILRKHTSVEENILPSLISLLTFACRLFGGCK